VSESSKMETRPVAVVIRMRLREGGAEAFSSWHARICTVAADLPGFISSEVNAPTPSGSPEWRITQHFRSPDQLHAWRQSDQHRDLLLEAASLVEDNGAVRLIEEEASDAHADGTVTEVITTYVKPDKVSEYRQWAAKVHQAEALFPGYRGTFIQPPASAGQSYWTTLVRFATPEQLDVWLSSSERRKLLREHKALTSSWSHHRAPSSFAGCFRLSSRPTLLRPRGSSRCWCCWCSFRSS
jgi:antibiotic biosynthesis monooxygenase (ABM) superfamily enzyme